MLIHEIKDVENNVSVVVYKISTGYSVGVRDNDAEMNVGSMTIYKTADAAIANANSFADRPCGFVTL